MVAEFKKRLRDGGGKVRQQALHREWKQDDVVEDHEAKCLGIESGWDEKMYRKFTPEEKW